MQIDKFKHEFKHLNGVFFDGDWVLFRDPLQLYNFTTEETVNFNSLEEALNYKIKGKTIEAWVSDWEAIILPPLNGGRGGEGGMSTFKFGHASGGGRGGNGKADLPARMNTKVGVNRSPEDMLKAFRDAHVNDSYESGVAVDEYGFVTRYVHGDATSVAIYGGKGEMVYHNHPGKIGGNFSDSDLLSTAMSPERGIVASGKEGDYKFVKTHKFNATGFAKAVKNATLKGKDYNDAADRWLKANQKKYGYTYSFTKAK